MPNGTPRIFGDGLLLYPNRMHRKAVTMMLTSGLPKRARVQQQELIWQSIKDTIWRYPLVDRVTSWRKCRGKFVIVMHPVSSPESLEQLQQLQDLLQQLQPLLPRAGTAAAVVVREWAPGAAAVKQVFVSNLSEEDMEAVLAQPPEAFAPKGWNLPWQVSDFLV